MFLSGTMLEDVTGVNSYEYASTHEMSAGDAGYIYFQIKDAAVFKANQKFFPSGRRFIPAAGSTLLCEVGMLNDAKKIVRSASNPFADDRSIWRLQIFNSDNLAAGTFALLLTLNQAGVIIRGSIQQAMTVQSDTTCLC